MKIFLPILILLTFLITACTPYNLTKVNKELEESNKKILEQQQEIDTLNKEVINLKQELETYNPQQFDFLIDLTQWREDEIIQALALTNTKFKNAKWFQYQYRGDDAYYDIVGEIFPIDPFYDIVFSKRNRQLTTNKLRIFNLDPGNKEIGDEEYEKYENNINKKTILNPEISCTKHKECRGTILLKCTSIGTELYSWFSYPYLFITRDDHGATLQTFKEFYC